MSTRQLLLLGPGPRALLGKDAVAGRPAVGSFQGQHLNLKSAVGAWLSSQLSVAAVRPGWQAECSVCQTTMSQHLCVFN